MCTVYAKSSDKETELKNLREICEEPFSKMKYDDFNTTSVHNVFYSAMGIYGEECKPLALKVIEEFIAWVRLYKSELYFPKTGVEKMIYTNILVRLFRFCKDFTNEEKLEKDELFHLYAKKFEEFEQLESHTNGYYRWKKFIDGHTRLPGNIHSVPNKVLLIGLPISFIVGGLFGGYIRRRGLPLGVQIGFSVLSFLYCLSKLRII